SPRGLPSARDTHTSCPPRAPTEPSGPDCPAVDRAGIFQTTGASLDYMAELYIAERYIGCQAVRNRTPIFRPAGGLFTLKSKEQLLPGAVRLTSVCTVTETRR